MRAGTDLAGLRAEAARLRGLRRRSVGLAPAQKRWLRQRLHILGQLEADQVRRAFRRQLALVIQLVQSLSSSGGAHSTAARSAPITHQPREPARGAAWCVCVCVNQADDKSKD